MIIKNHTTANISIGDIGITIPARGTYDLSNKTAHQLSQSGDLLDKVVDGSLLLIRTETPEELYDKNNTVRILVTGSVEGAKTVNTGESVVVTENNGHLKNNSIINWTLDKYLTAEESYTEKMTIPFNHIATLNQFLGGSWNVPTQVSLEWFIWDESASNFIRVNPEMRLSESFIAMSDEPLMMGTRTVSIKCDGSCVDDIFAFELGLGYLFECVNIHHYSTVVGINHTTNTIDIDPPIPMGGAIANARISLVDRAVAQIGNQISSSAINWVSPPRFQGDGKSYLQITLTNEDDSEPGLVTAMLNGWVEPGTLES